mmetsp:Transcript_32998/g.69236  ORF Transcript_32998/g.69236 Transcript_32998/m.69236 type:complete len:118 (+) Transcript_32998:169-522(+)
MPPPHLPVQPPGEATWTNTLRAMVDNMPDEMRLELQREMAQRGPMGGATAVITPPHITPTPTGQRQVTVLLPGQTTPREVQETPPQQQAPAGMVTHQQQTQPAGDLTEVAAAKPSLV